MLNPITILPQIAHFLKSKVPMENLALPKGAFEGGAGKGELAGVVAGLFIIKYNLIQDFVIQNLQ